jgi:hypothetical protein
MRTHLVCLLVGSLVLAGTAGGVSGPDSYLCYQAGITKGQPKIASGLTASMTDALGGPQTFDVTKIATLCNPTSLNGAVISHAAVHEEGFAIKAEKGAPKFVKSDHVTVDPFAQRTLTLTGPASLLDVTPTAPGTTPPTPFGSDPTSDPDVNRFKCYKAKLPKGSPKFVAPPPQAVVDDFFPGGQPLVLKKLIKVCNPADVNGETPGAEARQSSSLVCYQVALPKGTPKLSTQTVSTNGANFGAHVLDAKKVAELCVAAAVDPPSSDGPPIVAPSNTWTWVDFPDAACDDGTTTGIGVNLTSSQNVLVFFNGGGACWDYTTCYILNTAVHGPFGQAQFDALAAGFGGTILDRQLAGNPFADWNLVFVPYCTGDVHGGDNVATYQNGAMTRMFHHVGHSNVLAYLHRLGPTFPTIGRMVVSGSSSGGFGALLNFATFRGRWPGGKMYLLDDSGPFLEAGGIPAALITAWFASWHLGDVTGPVCGAACQTDLSQLMPALVARYPGDRMALLSSVQDAVNRSLFQLSAADFEADLLQMAADRLDPTATFRYFFVTGSSDTMLGAPGSFSQNGVGLLGWIGQEVTDDPAWVSVKP